MHISLPFFAGLISKESASMYESSDPAFCALVDIATLCNRAYFLAESASLPLKVQILSFFQCIYAYEFLLIGPKSKWRCFRYRVAFLRGNVRAHRRH